MTKNKTFILSDEDDHTTDDVLHWIQYFEKDFIRVNGNNSFNFSEIELNNHSRKIELKSGKYVFDINEIDCYWYRRGDFKINKIFIDFKNKKLQKISDKSIFNEYEEIKDYIYLCLEQKKKVGSYYDNKTNKLFNLSLAKKYGLSIPDTLVTVQKPRLKEFINKHEKVITKPLGQTGIMYDDEDIQLDGLTAEVTDLMLKKIPRTFPPSLFQAYVEKAYELRIFYLNEKCYSSAIFSQLDQQTKIDFRNYNREKPNRVCAYELPFHVSRKIIKLMNKLEMQSGSLDMIVTPYKEFVFLEVNPIGQFAQVSYSCNYYLEKKLAENIVNK